MTTFSAPPPPLPLSLPKPSKEREARVGKLQCMAAAAAATTATTADGVVGVPTGGAPTTSHHPGGGSKGENCIETMQACMPPRNSNSFAPFERRRNSQNARTCVLFGRYQVSPRNRGIGSTNGFILTLVVFFFAAGGGGGQDCLQWVSFLGLGKKEWDYWFWVSLSLQPLIISARRLASANKA